MIVFNGVLNFLKPVTAVAVCLTSFGAWSQVQNLEQQGIDPSPPPVILPKERQVAPPDFQIPSFRGVIPKGTENIYVNLKKIVVEGADAYRDGEIEEITDPLLNKDVSLKQLYEAASQIQDLYNDDKFILTKVTVPPQKVDEGQFKIQVVEGFISDVRLDGDIGGAGLLVGSFLEELVNQKPVSQGQIERYLLLCNDIPGVTARAVLRPGIGGPGSSSLVVSLNHKPYDLFFTANNRGGDANGPSSFALGGSTNSASYFGEKISVVYFNTFEFDEQRFYSLEYSQHLLGEGLTGKLYASAAPTLPGDELARTDIKSRSWRLGAELRFPWFKSRAVSMESIAGLENKSERVSVEKNENTNDDLSVFYTGIDLNTTDTFSYGGELGLTSLKWRYRHGTGLLGAKDAKDQSKSRAEGTNLHDLMRLEFQRTQPLPGPAEWFFNAAGQYSWKRLLASEEFKVGGEEFGRGYAPAELTGDHGLGITNEIRLPVRKDWAWLNYYEPYIFYDFAYIWNKDNNTTEEESLASAGIGMRFNLNDKIRFEAEGARNMTRIRKDEDGERNPGRDNENFRGYFRVIARF